MTVCPPSARTTTLQGSSSPIRRSSGQRPVREQRVAGAQDEIGLHLLAELVAQSGLHVDLGQHAEALGLERVANAGECRRRRAAASGW